MSVQLISFGKDKTTAMVVIHTTGDNGKKKSRTRHLVRLSDGTYGYHETVMVKGVPTKVVAERWNFR